MSLSHAALLPYGWSSERENELPPGTRPARILRHDGHTMLAVASMGTVVVRPSSELDPMPTVGDWVAILEASSSAADQVAALRVLPRRSLLRRQSADGVREQALAANVDLVLVTCGVDRPIRPGRIQRVAVQAWESGASPVLVLTKAAEPRALDLPRLELEHPGVPVLVTAALEGSGLDALREVVSGRTAVLVGESGAGKSTLANALLGRQVAATGAVREGDAKGRHTTTARQLHLLPGAGGGVLIDTPGIRSMGLAADVDSVDAAFTDIESLAADCRFTDCGHDSEPDCAVQAAVAGGQLAWGRLEGWRRLRREAASAALRASPHEFRAAGRRFGRAQRQAPKRR